MLKSSITELRQGSADVPAIVTMLQRTFAELQHSFAGLQNVFAELQRSFAELQSVSSNCEGVLQYRR